MKPGLRYSACVLGTFISAACAADLAQWYYSRVALGRPCWELSSAFEAYLNVGQHGVPPSWSLFAAFSFTALAVILWHFRKQRWAGGWSEPTRPRPL